MVYLKIQEKFVNNAQLNVQLVKVALLIVFSALPLENSLLTANVKKDSYKTILEFVLSKRRTSTG